MVHKTDKSSLRCQVTCIPYAVHNNWMACNAFRWLCIWPHVCSRGVRLIHNVCILFSIRLFFYLFSLHPSVGLSVGRSGCLSIYLPHFLPAFLTLPEQLDNLGRATVEKAVLENTVWSAFNLWEANVSSGAAPVTDVLPQPSPSPDQADTSAAVHEKASDEVRLAFVPLSLPCMIPYMLPCIHVLFCFCSAKRKAKVPEEVLCCSIGLWW